MCVTKEIENQKKTRNCSFCVVPYIVAFEILRGSNVKKNRTSEENYHADSVKCADTQQEKH